MTKPRSATHMADQIVVLKVDLECERCYKKIRKVLCKIQDKMNIRTVSFDEKSNAVTILGPFDAEKVCRKLCCQAGRIIKEIQIKDKEKDSKDKEGDKAKASKPAEKEAGNADKKDGGKPEKEAKADKATAKPDKEKAKDSKPDKEKAKDSKPEKKVRFEFDDAPAADAKHGKQGPEPPIVPPMMVPPVAAAQGVAVPSIWPAPAGSVSCYSYNPAYDEQSYYAGGGGGCQCGSCGKPAQAGGYYGVPVYDHQGWYYGNRHPYYQQQQPCCEDPNAGCSVM